MTSCLPLVSIDGTVIDKAKHKHNHAINALIYSSCIGPLYSKCVLDAAVHDNTILCGVISRAGNDPFISLVDLVHFKVV